jgi:hypothetical protein
MTNTKFKFNQTRSLVGVLLITITLFLMSCGEDNDPTTIEFDLDYTSSISVPANSGLNLPFDLLSPNVTTNAESTFGSNNTNKDLISEITLSELVARITSPNDQRFDFVDDITLYINADGLSELELATVTDVSDNIGTTLEFTTTGNNLKDYLIKDQFQIRAEVTTDKNITEEVNIELDSKFSVLADLI